MSMRYAKMDKLVSTIWVVDSWGQKNHVLGGDWIPCGSGHFGMPTAQACLQLVYSLLYKSTPQITAG